MVRMPAPASRLLRAFRPPHLARGLAFGRSGLGHGASDRAFAMIRPYDYNDSLMSTLNPFISQRRGPERFTLLCVRADSTKGTDFDGVNDASFARAAKLAEKGQTVLKGGSMLLSLPQIESASVRGPEDDVKLQPGAVVTISLHLYGGYLQFGFIASSALLAPVGSDLISYNPNPMQATATVEAVTQDTADVLVPGVYMQDLNERIRLTEQGEGWYRANVDREIMAAHVTSRNFLMATDLADIRNDVCLLWPEPLVPADVTFVNASTGATLTEQLGKAAGVRRLIDEDVHLLVHGRRVQFLDPTLCVMPAVENVKCMVVTFGGCFASWLGFANLGYPFDALSLTGFVVSMSMPYLWNRIWRYLPGATKSKFVADPRAGAKRVVEK